MLSRCVGLQAGAGRFPVDVQLPHGFAYVQLFQKRTECLPIRIKAETAFINLRVAPSNPALPFGKQPHSSPYVAAMFVVDKKRPIGRVGLSSEIRRSGAFRTGRAGGDLNALQAYGLDASRWTFPRKSDIGKEYGRSPIGGSGAKTLWGWSPIKKARRERAFFFDGTLTESRPLWCRDRQQDRIETIDRARIGTHSGEFCPAVRVALAVVLDV